jgi:hypothetical protein
MRGFCTIDKGRSAFFRGFSCIKAILATFSVLDDEYSMKEYE